MFWNNRYSGQSSENGGSPRDEQMAATLKDYGPAPLVVNIKKAATQNNNFRLALWTGEYFQITLMSLKPGENIGLEMHDNLDQLLVVVEGRGEVKMGKTKDRLTFSSNLWPDYAITVPAGTWHNVYNTGSGYMKLYSVYAPPQHPKGTIHRTKADAEAAEAEGEGYAIKTFSDSELPKKEY